MDEPRSLSMDEDILPNLKSLGLCGEESSQRQAATGIEMS